MFAMLLYWHFVIVIVSFSLAQWIHVEKNAELRKKRTPGDKCNGDEGISREHITVEVEIFRNRQQQRQQER